nr:MAG TPA: hypothetical protein [Caudoviricetes sp.]
MVLVRSAHPHYPPQKSSIPHTPTNTCHLT